MIRVCIAVDRGTARSTTLYVREQNPGCALSVVFPLDPDTFFVRDAQEGIEAEIAA
jgi:hypothetical protein